MLQYALKRKTKATNLPDYYAESEPCACSGLNSFCQKPGIKPLTSNCNAENSLAYAINKHTMYVM